MDPRNARTLWMTRNSGPWRTGSYRKHVAKGSCGPAGSTLSGYCHAVRRCTEGPVRARDQSNLQGCSVGHGVVLAGALVFVRMPGRNRNSAGPDHGRHDELQSNWTDWEVLTLECADVALLIHFCSVLRQQLATRESHT